MTFTTHYERLHQLNAVLPVIIREELPVPVVFSNEDNGFDLVWDMPRGRVTLYIGESYEIELVPEGDLIPLTTESPEEAVKHVIDYYTQKLSSDVLVEFVEDLEKNREEVRRRRAEKNLKRFR